MEYLEILDIYKNKEKEIFNEIQPLNNNEFKYPSLDYSFGDKTKFNNKGKYFEIDQNIENNLIEKIDDNIYIFKYKNNQNEYTFNLNKETEVDILIVGGGGSGGKNNGSGGGAGTVIYHKKQILNGNYIIEVGKGGDHLNNNGKDSIIKDSNNRIVYKAIGGSSGTNINGYINKGGSSGGLSSYQNNNIIDYENNDTLTEENIFNYNNVLIENDLYLNDLITYPEGIYGNTGGYNKEFLDYYNFFIQNKLEIIE